VGGGLPVGAFAGKSEIMNHLSPDGPVYQAGTLSGNPLAMAAGYTMLKELNNNRDIFESLDKKTAYLHEGMAKVLNDANIDHQINRIGSMISIHFCKEPVVDFETAAHGNNPKFKPTFMGCWTEVSICPLVPSRVIF